MQFMTINAVSKALAVNRSTVERLIKSGQLQAIKVNRSVRILEDSFDDFIKRNLMNKSTSNNNESKEIEPGRSTLRSMMKHFGAISGSKEECEQIAKLIKKSKIAAEF